MNPISRSALVLISAALSTSALFAQAVNTPVAAEHEPESVPAAASSAASGSGVRIVRLSQTRGDVQLDRHIDRGYEAAFANLPITQHAQLKTGEGVAEIEFEDNSSLRVTPNTIVDFPELRRTPEGATVSTVHVVQGLVFVSLANSKGNTFTLAYGARRLALAPAAHVELSVSDAASRVAVLEGAARVEDASGATVSEIAKKHSAFLDPASSTAAPTEVAKVEKTPYDDWDKSSVDYHKQYAQAAAYQAGAGTGVGSYGISDMNYYGSFVTLDGCGQVWRPYFASTAWDPYGNGVMAYYGGGAGYSYVSPYPWGWTPYHSGSWMQCGGGAWGWRPTGGFVGLGNTNGLRRLQAAAGAGVPAPGHPTMVALSATPLPVSRQTDAGTFAFKQDSAGLGVPRQVFGKLGEISSTVARQGVFSTPVISSTSLVASRSEREGATYTARTGVANGGTRGMAQGQGAPVSNVSRGGAGMSSGMAAGAGSSMGHGSAGASAGGGGHR